jgi:hypothetical protein
MSGNAQIQIYKNNILRELINLIKGNDDWVENPSWFKADFS